MRNNHNNTALAYDNTFYDTHTEGALESARVIAPLMFQMAPIGSVVDVGCGRGAWLKAFLEIKNDLRTVGIDGAYVDQTQLLIDPRNFVTMDLNQLVRIEGKYDLAICLEVAEHLSFARARPLIAALTECSPLVLFSAAIPDQTGTNHINMRWPTFWKSLFAEHGYVRLDPIRRHVWQDRRVQWWYQQNAFLFASASVLASSPVLAAEHKMAQENPLCLIREDILGRYLSFRGLLGKIPYAFWHAVRDSLSNK